MNIAVRCKSEKEFTARVRYEAQLAGWELIYHTWNSMHSAKGFPDLVMVKGERLIFAELKMRKGKVSLHQKEWLEGLGRVPGVEVYTWWYPDDIDTILDILSEHRRQGV